MEIYDLNTWEEFEAKIFELHRESQRNGCQPWIGPLYRGQSNASWHLTTTLERYIPNRNSPIRYYDLIYDINVMVQETNKQKFTIDSKEKFAQWLLNSSQDRHRIFQADSYMVYLRQFGFPSPLLDWTQSPEIAAYFAFSNLDTPATARVAVWALFKPSSELSNTYIEDWQIMHIGHDFDVHERHFLQKAEYTTCIEKHGNMFTYGKIESHTDDISLGHYILKKYTLPISERQKVLRILDQRRINEYEVYKTDESFLRTLAMREMYLPD